MLRLLLSSRLARKKIAYQRLTEPFHLNLLSLFVALFGSYRDKINFDLIIRQHYAYGIIQAADHAKSLGIEIVTLIEFGVGNGAGLKKMQKIARSVSRITGVRFDIYGFDITTGMPESESYKDLPDAFPAGTYKTDVKALQSSLDENTKLIIGDVKDTVRPFIKLLSPQRPIGFIVFDLDLYYSTKAALEICKSDATYFLPYIWTYFDNIVTPRINSKLGELLAIEEFNKENELRIIEPYPFLECERIFKNAAWIKQMRVLNIMDHPTRIIKD